MSDYNSITARFYDISDVEILDSSGDGHRVRIENADTAYSGGFGTATLVLGRDPMRPLPIARAGKIKLFNGPTMIWAGHLSQDGRYVSENGSGVRLTATGMWGHILSRRVIDKRWADDRLSEWMAPYSAYSGNDQSLTEIMQVDTNGRARFTPKAVAFSNQWYGRRLYSMPIGQTVKRITLSYDMQEAAQAWQLEMFNETSVANVWSVAASGASTRDDTLATPSRNVFVLFRSGAAQTPPSDGTVYGQISNVMVYSETGNINAYEIFRDVRAMVPELSSNERDISATLTRAIEPFYTVGPETLASVLDRAAAHGTPSNGSIAYGCRDVGGGAIGLFAEPYPNTDDWEIEVNLHDPNVTGHVEIVRDVEGVVNWVPLTYTGYDGRQYTITPDDYALLKDDASIAAYGKRTPPGGVLRLGAMSAAYAIEPGLVLLAKFKDPQITVSGPITLTGYAMTRTGAKVPVANLLHAAQYGLRVRIVNFIGDTGAGLTAVVSHAAYSDAGGGQISLSFGVPDSLPIVIARLMSISATAAATA